jgi:hypothetical protein
MRFSCELLVAVTYHCSLATCSQLVGDATDLVDNCSDVVAQRGAPAWRPLEVVHQGSVCVAVVAPRADDQRGGAVQKSEFGGAARRLCPHKCYDSCWYLIREVLLLGLRET